MFERAYRVQMNTQEQVLLFLPSLWLAHSYGFSKSAAIIGGIWILARIGYVITYLRDPATRSVPFTAALVCTMALMGMAGWKIVQSALAGWA
jgi:uncharacterized MAPEG superfamily protein